MGPAMTPNPRATASTLDASDIAIVGAVVIGPSSTAGRGRTARVRHG